jgi:hypothetical protein
MHDRVEDVGQKHMFTHKAKAGICKPMSAVFGLVAANTLSSEAFRTIPSAISRIFDNTTHRCAARSVNITASMALAPQTQAPGKCCQAALQPAAKALQMHQLVVGHWQHWRGL